MNIKDALTSRYGKWHGAKARLFKELKERKSGYAQGYVGKLVEGKVPLTEEAEIKLAGLFGINREQVRAMFKIPNQPHGHSTEPPVCTSECKRLIADLRRRVELLEAREKKMHHGRAEEVS